MRYFFFVYIRKVDDFADKKYKYLIEYGRKICNWN